MSRRSGALVRVVGLGVLLALAFLLLFVREASGAKYTVAQCGWHVGADADWGDSTGGAKFRPDAYCATPPGTDPFDGAHMKSFTRSGASTVSGTRFARWRWVAPSGTSITRVSGTWWHALHDGMEQRIGAGTWSGGFSPFASAASTDVTPRNFVAGFSPGVPAIEDRLLCARAESKWCSLDASSWSAVRALTLTVEDNGGPAAGIGGDLTAGGWRRGIQGVQFWGSDGGGGIRYGETSIDGARVALAEYPCAKEMIGGEWRGTRMRPCEPSASGSAIVMTANFSDGPHTLGHCATDFAGNAACVAPRTVLIDNTPPAHPRSVSVVGGEGWRNTNDFDLGWANPDQGRGSPIGGASWRVLGAAGFDTGVQFAPGRDLTALRDLRMPMPGAYLAQIWLRDEAGNEAPPSAISVPLRFDDVAPGIAFEADDGVGFPGTVRANVTDVHSGPAAGTILYRRLGTERWIELATKFEPGAEPGSARLLGHLPGDLGPGTYVFRADAVDGAGNKASSTRRVDGTEMALRKVPPAAVVAKGPAPSAAAKTRVFARLRWRQHRGPQVTVPFGATAMLSGRLVNAEGAGLAGRRLRVVSRPSRGALARRRIDAVVTGAHGGFRLPLSRGPSRRITVTYRGEPGLDRARRPALALRVRGAAVLHARPLQLRTGEAVRLWGRVRTRGAPVPRRGKLVAVQYYESAARRWRPVLVTRTNHDGHFHARYRFRYISGHARIRLRAVALAEERWPYVPGASAPVTIQVTG
ncbi:MAG: hypothetical protein WD827_07780 [Solirubrobacterales bacterium]